MATQEYEDPATIENRGVRFIAWTGSPGSTCSRTNATRVSRATTRIRREVTVSRREFDPDV